MHIKTILRRPSAIGIAFGTLFMAASLTPSLIPREWIEQAVIAALSFLSGYGIGVGLNALWRYLELPTLSQKYRPTATLVLLAASALLLFYALFKSLGWQNNVRTTVGMDPIDSAYPLRVLLLGVVIVVILLLIFRLLGWISAAIVRTANRFIPSRLGQVLGIVIAVVFIVFLVNGVLIQAIASVLNSSYALTDSTTYDNVEQPTSPLRSGSPDSLIAWDTLGREGRRFTATGPSADDIAAFWGGEPAMEPVRVYIGSQSADTLQARAELALQEMIRTGAFERDVLALVTSTGNGWVDANAVDSLEYMYGGDTATVAFQYSYLPSVYALLADKDAATEASLAMFNEIHQYWRTLDEDTRPEFYLYGLSLGAYGSQAAVSSVSLFNDPIDGALWAGPPFVSEFWRQITRDRDAGTPIWRPIYQDGTIIRFTNEGEGLQDAPDEWEENRFVYLQQAGDPIVFFPPSSLYRAPEWLSGDARSPKAPSDMVWYPVVTFWQLIFDMVLATSDTLPDGNGHRYASDSYIESWVALTQPTDWDDQKTEELKTLFNTMSNPNKP